MPEIDSTAGPELLAVAVIDKTTVGVGVVGVVVVGVAVDRKSVV